MNISKEFYENAFKELNQSQQLSNNFLQCMHQYYLVQNKDKYNSRNRLEDFGEFLHYFQEFLNTPITFGNTLQEQLVNQRPIDVKLAIKKTIEYFNKFFNMTMVNK